MTVRGGLDWDIEVRLEGITKLEHFRDLVRDVKTDLKGVRGANLSAKAGSDAKRADRERKAAERATRSLDQLREREQNRLVKIEESTAKKKDKIRDKEVRDTERQQDQIARQAIASSKRIDREREAKHNKELRRIRTRRVRLRNALRSERAERARTARIAQQNDPQFIAQQRIAAAGRSLQVERILANSQKFQDINKSLKEIRTGGPAAARSLKNAERNASGLASQFSRLVKVVIVLEGIRLAFQGLGTAFSSSIKRAADLETALLGIATVISSTSSAVSGLGELEGAVALEAGFQEAGRQLDLLRKEALRTAATFEDLAFAFQTGLGPGLAAGLNIDEVRKFSVDIAKAAAAIGLEQNQLAEEIRSILQGTINPRNTRIATVLNIKPEDIRKAKELGNLAGFLEDRFKAFGTAANRSLRTFNVLVVNAQDALKNLGAESLEPVFKELKLLFEDIITTVTGAELGQAFETDPAVLRNFQRLGEAIAGAVSSVRDLVTSLRGADFDALVSLAETLGEGFQATLFPALKGVLDALSVMATIVKPILDAFVGIIETAPGLVRIGVQFLLLSKLLPLVATPMFSLVRSVTQLVKVLPVVIGFFKNLTFIIGAIAGPIGLVVAGAAALALAVVALNAALDDGRTDNQTDALERQREEYDRLSSAVDKARDRLNALPAAFQGNVAAIGDALKATDKFKEALAGVVTSQRTQDDAQGLSDGAKRITEAQSKISQDLEREQAALASAAQSFIQSRDEITSKLEAAIAALDVSNFSSLELFGGEGKTTSNIAEAVVLQREYLTLLERSLGLQGRLDEEDIGVKEAATLGAELSTVTSEIEKVIAARDKLIKGAVNALPGTETLVPQGTEGILFPEPTAEGLRGEEETINQIAEIVELEAQRQGSAAALNKIKQADNALAEEANKLLRARILLETKDSLQNQKGRTSDLEEQLRQQRGEVSIAQAEDTEGQDALRLELDFTKEQIKLKEQLNQTDANRRGVLDQINKIEKSGSAILQQALPTLRSLEASYDSQVELQRSIIASATEELRIRKANLVAVREQAALLQSIDLKAKDQTGGVDSRQSTAENNFALRRNALDGQILAPQQRALALLQIESEERQKLAVFDQQRLQILLDAVVAEQALVLAGSNRGKELALEQKLLNSRLGLSKERARTEKEITDDIRKRLEEENTEGATGRGIREAFASQVKTDQEIGVQLGNDIANGLRNSLQQVFADIFDPNASSPLKNAISNLAQSIGQAIFNAAIEKAIIQPILQGIGLGPATASAKGGPIGFAEGGSTGDMTAGGKSESNTIPLRHAPPGADRRDKLLGVLRKGEYVLTPPMIRQLGGVGFLENMRMGRKSLLRNLGSLPSFARPRLDLGRGRLSPIQQFRDGGSVGSLPRGRTGTSGSVAAAQAPTMQTVLPVDASFRRQVVTSEHVFAAMAADRSRFRALLQQ